MPHRFDKVFTVKINFYKVWFQVPFNNSVSTILPGYKKRDFSYTNCGDKMKKIGMLVVGMAL